MQGPLCAAIFLAIAHFSRPLLPKQLTQQHLPGHMNSCRMLQWENTELSISLLASPSENWGASWWCKMSLLQTWFMTEQPGSRFTACTVSSALWRMEKRNLKLRTQVKKGKRGLWQDKVIHRQSKTQKNNLHKRYLPIYSRLVSTRLAWWTLGLPWIPTIWRFQYWRVPGSGSIRKFVMGSARRKMRQPPHQLRELSDLPKVPKVWNLNFKVRSVERFLSLWGLFQLQVSWQFAFQNAFWAHQAMSDHWFPPFAFPFHGNPQSTVLGHQRRRPRHFSYCLLNRASHHARYKTMRWYHLVLKGLVRHSIC